MKNFKTPLTELWFEDSNGKKLEFEVVDNIEQKHEVWIDDDENKKIIPKDFVDCRLRIRTKDLKLNEKYYFCSSQELEWRDADERVEVFGITKDDITLSIGMPEYNEGEKWYQNENPKYVRIKTKNGKEEVKKLKDLSDEAIINTSMIEYDESKFDYYNFYFDKQPFRFSILDYEQEYMYITVAWINGIKDHMPDYENATDVWTWTF